MLLPLTLALIAYACWRGGSPIGVALMVAGFLLQLRVTLQLARATVDPAGGHAEWVREGSTRPRLVASPLWGVGVGLLVVGFVWVLWAGSVAGS